MKLLVNTVIVLSLVSTSVIAGINDVLLKQCKFTVDGKGTDNLPANGYISGLVSGQLYTTKYSRQTDAAKNATNKQNVKTACSEALNNKSTKPFSEKLQWGISVVLDKKYFRHSNLK